MAANNFHKFSVGDLKVTMISDGFFPLSADMLPAVDDDKMEAVLASANLPAGIYESAVNAFIIETGEDVHLVDAGGAGLVDSLGKLPESMKAAGFSPDQIKSLIISHLHPDHIGGATQNGKAAFPNAEMIVSKDDHAFWTNPDIRAGAPDDAKPYFDMAVGAVNAYSDRLKLIGDDEEVAPGVTSVALPGHTPGHTGFILSSGNERLMLWSDVVHMQYLQFADPTISLIFDIDPEQAVATRKKVLDQVATDGLQVAGMHLRYPGKGFVEREGNAYRFSGGS